MVSRHRPSTPRGRPIRPVISSSRRHWHPLSLDATTRTLAFGSCGDGSWRNTPSHHALRTSNAYFTCRIGVGDFPPRMTMEIADWLFSPSQTFDESHLTHAFFVVCLVKFICRRPLATHLDFPSLSYIYDAHGAPARPLDLT